MKRALSVMAAGALLSGLLGQCALAWAQDATLIFSATGDIPYSPNEYTIFQQQIADHNRYSPSEFFVHLGDIKNQSDSCEATRYEQMADALRTLAVPVFIVPGDNEYNDCSNPSQAWTLWETYFTEFEKNFCGAPIVERQEVRHENFAWTSKGVLLMGINLVGGRVHDRAEWNLRMQQDADWVSQQFQAKGAQVRGAVVFAQAGPDVSRDLFFNQFRQAASAFGKPVLFLQGDGHTWLMDRPFPEQNILRVQVNRGALEQPLQVTVTLDNQNLFAFQRNPWVGSQSFNMPPCVQAGPDQTITLSEPAVLSGSVSDDGDPAPPGTVTVMWSKVSGSGAVTFGNANALVTTASFSAPGTYVLRLTANDGQLQGSDEVTIVVNPAGPSITINDVEMEEGNAGTVDFVFTVSLFAATGQQVSVDYATADGTATSGNDYVSNSGTLTFSGSTTEQMITVVVNGDQLDEPDETFFINLANATNATIVDAQGVGTIDDDDLPPLPGISSFSPTSGLAGTEVTIIGNKLTGVTAVHFNGTAATSFTVDSNTRLRATVPAGATTGVISVTNAFGSAISAADFTVTLPPLSFIPVHDAYVKLSTPASNFGAASTLRQRKTSTEAINSYLKFEAGGLSGPATPVVVQSATLRLYVTDASDDGGSVHLVSNNYAGTTTPWTESGLIWDNAPAISGPALSAAGTVSVGSWVELEVTPAIVGDGIYSFGLKNNSSDIVNYNSKEGANKPELVILVRTGSPPAPTIASFTPTTGVRGSEVTITGANFGGATAVTFNGAAATSFTVDLQTQIRATVPAEATTGKISVTTASGTAVSAGDFVMLVPPIITSFTPVTGPSGTEVTITGTNFTGTTNVTFNGIPTASFTVDSDTQLRAKVPVAPTGATTTGKVGITNSAGSGLSAVAFTVTVPPLSFTPVHDAYVKLSTPASNFGSASTLRQRQTGTETINSYLKFDVSGLSGPVQSARLRLYVTDASNDGGSVYLVSNNYAGTTAPPWTESGLIWDNAPAISGPALSAAGAISVGSWVELEVTPAIVGDGIYSFGLKSTASDPVFYSSKEGANAPELVIRISPPPPTITSFTPSSGAVGIEVTIAGTNLGEATAVAFNGVAATAFMVDSPAQIRATVPAGAATGKISVTTSSGNALSAADFTVTVPPATFTFTPLYDAYVRLSSPAQSYPSTPALLQRVTSGEVINTYLKFNATGLSGPVEHAALRLYVTDGSNDGGAVYVVSNNYAGTTTAWTESGLKWSNAPAIGGTALSIAGAASVGNWIELDVTTAISGDGIYSFGLKNSSSDVVNYSSKEGINPPELVIATGTGSLLALTITSFTPSSGYVGTEVTITGTHLGGTTVVAFNGTAAASFTVDSSTQIRATVPAGATTGKISVITSSGTALSATDFTVTAPPATFTFTPLYDAYVRLSSPTLSYPSIPSLLQRVTSSEVIHTYLKFNVTGLGGPVERVTLRLYVTNASDDGGSVYVVSNNYAGSPDGSGWTESGLNWDNAPAIGGTALRSAGAVSVGSWIELEVTSAISGNGIYSFGLKNNSSDVVNYSSKEGANPPELVIRMASSSPLARRMGTSEETQTLPAQFKLFPNYPNPFNAHTMIRYALPQEAKVRLLIFNTLGQLVRKLVDEIQPPGYKRLLWDGKNDAGANVRSGVYFYQLEIGLRRFTGKMIVLQ